MPTASLKRDLRRVRARLKQARRSQAPNIPADPADFGRLLVGELDSWQEEILTSSSKKQIVLASRQVGKSTMAGVKSLYLALSKPRSLILLVAPSERQAKELFSKIANFYGDLAGLGVEAISYRRLGVEFANGSRIEALPGTERTIRGFSGVGLLVIDEAARIEDDLYFALTPMLAVSGGSIMMLSTPFGKRGIFHEEWTTGEGWERHEMRADECPRIPQEFLEEERISLPAQIFRQEYLCSFEETDDQVFSTEDVENMVTDDVTPLFPRGA